MLVSQQPGFKGDEVGASHVATLKKQLEKFFDRQPMNI
jgi:hypothetical protein